jgi:hypothetical protein
LLLINIEILLLPWKIVSRAVLAVAPTVIDGTQSTCERRAELLIWENSDELMPDTTPMVTESD